MSFRHKKAYIKSQRHWHQFMVNNVDIVRTLRLPHGIVEDRELWEDVIAYGYPESIYDTIEDTVTPDFNIKQLSQSQYQQLVLLTERYFEAGFAYIEPFALRKNDRERLRARFDPDGTHMKRRGYTEDK